MNACAAPDAGPVARRIADLLGAAFSPAEVDVRNDSHLHAGHAGAREGGHFHVRIRSARFAGLAPVARHRLIYDALGPLGSLGVHALSIDARASGPD
jgi:BolA family transcriptional regulator, general stress-responsive regulator